MATDPRKITHPFYDIEVEPVSDPPGASLVKILALDGRRFTFWVHARLGPAAVEYVKEVIDSGVVTDVIIEEKDGGFGVRESPTPLKKHG